MCVEAMKNKFIILLLSFLMFPFALMANDSAVNIGFENGLEGWKCYQTTNYNAINDNSINDVNLWNKPPLSPMEVDFINQNVDESFRRFMVFENPSDNQIQYDGGCGVVSLKTNMGNKFLKLGNSNYDSECEKVSYTFAYDPSRKFIKYAYAMVMQEPPSNPKHEDYERPSFIASVSISRNGGFDELDSCVSTRYYGDHGKFPDFSKCTTYNNLAVDWNNINVLSKNWSYNLIDLEAVGALQGDSVTLSFATFDCTQGGHFGYAYVDAEFVDSKFEIEGGSSNAVCVGDNVTFSCPGAGTYVGETYEWKVGDNIVSTDSSMSHTFLQSGDYVVSLTISVDGGNTCIQARTMTETIHVMNCICPDNGKITIDGVSVDESFSVCKDQLLQIGFQAGIPLINPQYVWTFGNNSLNEGNESQDGISNFSASTQGTLALQVTSNGCKAGVNFAINLNVENCLANSCNDCPSRFSPTPGEKYVVSGWVSAASQIGVKDSFEGVSIQLSFDLIGGGDPMVVECYPDGNIIDGWQRISKNFVIPQNAEKMRIALKNESSDNRVYFDDIRFHPFNASVKSYVYDPKTLRLAAELDDENYATFYEYDEEGALVRIKKETERGVMTIREARQSKPKN